MIFGLDGAHVVSPSACLLDAFGNNVSVIVLLSRYLCTVGVYSHNAPLEVTIAHCYTYVKATAGLPWERLVFCCHQHVLLLKLRLLYVEYERLSHWRAMPQQPYGSTRN